MRQHSTLEQRIMEPLALDPTIRRITMLVLSLIPMDIILRLFSIPGIIDVF
jgi:hypothetical protein